MNYFIVCFCVHFFNVYVVNKCQNSDTGRQTNIVSCSSLLLIELRADGCLVNVSLTHILMLMNTVVGWFELVPPDFRRATCFRSIAEVADSMPRKFFTRSNLKVIRIEKGTRREY